MIKGLWSYTTNNGSPVYSIISKHKEHYIENCKNMVYLDDNIITIQYGKKKYKGVVKDDKIEWVNQRTGKITYWYRMNWIIGADNLIGKFRDKSSIIGLQETSGKITGIRGKLFIILTDDGKVLEKTNIIIDSVQYITNNHYHSNSRICKYM